MISFFFKVLSPGEGLGGAASFLSITFQFLFSIHYKNMSLASFLIKLWAQIRALFETMPADLQTAVKTAVAITENLKNFTGSPAADLLTALIPGDAGNLAIAALRTALPKILTALKLAGQDSRHADDAALTACGIQTLQSLGGDARSAFLHNIAIMLAQAAAGGKLTWKDGVCLLEWYYQQHVKQAAA